MKTPAFILLLIGSLIIVNEMNADDMKKSIALNSSTVIELRVTIRKDQTSNKKPANLPSGAISLSFSESKIYQYDIVLSHLGHSKVIDTINISRISGLEPSAFAPFELLAATLHGREVMYTYKKQGKIFFRSVNIDSSNDVGPVHLETGNKWSQARFDVKDGNVQIILSDDGNKRSVFVRQTSGQITRAPTD